MCEFNPDDFLTTAELAEFLRVKPKYIKNIAKRGEIDFYYVARKYLFHKKDIQKYLEKNRVQKARCEEC